MGERADLQKVRTGFFTYPWDLISEGPAAVVENMAVDLNCNAILVNAQYHHARVLRPRATGPKTFQTHDAVAAYYPKPEHFEPDGLFPVVDESLANLNILAETRAACLDQGMDFGVWIVGLHNSSLGRKHPELCVKNCFGDVYTYSLCPSQQKTREYMKGLVGDVCVQFDPDRIVVEAIGVLGLRHWDHHELFMTEWNESLEMLTSICFCEACQQKGVECGVNVDALQQEIKRLAHILMNEERGELSHEFILGETSSLLMEIEGLWSYLQVCSRSVSDLVADLHAIAKETGVALEVIPSSFHRPSSRAWLERALLKSLDKVCDHLLIASYFTSSAEVEADLRWSSYLAPDASLTAGINACVPTQSAVALESQVRACLSTGCAGVYFYNYGLLSQKRLEWVAQATSSVFKG